MNKVVKNKKQVMMDKLLILLAVICVTLGLLIIVLYLDDAEISIFAKNTDKIKESYTSTEDSSSTNTWDISATENDNVIATLLEVGTLTISGTGNMKDWSTVESVPWTSVRDQIKSIEFSGAVTRIGKYAFMGCKNLTNIEIPISITSIGTRAFSGCISLTNIEIPSSVTSIGNYVFNGCTSLTSIEVDENNTAYKDDNGVLYSKDGIKIIVYPAGKKETEYKILNGMKSIEWMAFDGCTSLIKIEIPSGVTSISGQAFHGCESLTNIEIPNSVTSIGDYAFLGCKRLTNIELPNSITNIGRYVFSGCESLTNINIPGSVTSIGDKVFYGCTSLTSIDVDENNTAYKDDNGVLYSKDGTKIIVYPAGKKETEYKILNGVISTEAYAFYRCENLINIKVPNSVTSIGAYAFYACTSLESVEIPNSVTSIETHTFGTCTSLKRILISSDVTSIGYNAFFNCSILTIICKSGTAAETYAKENNIPYRTIHLSSTQQEIDEINLTIKNIQPQTTMQEFKSDLSSEIAYIILDSQGNEIQDVLTIIGTGCQIKLEDNTIYTIIIAGDADGDGQANIDDILAINKHRLKKAPLTLEYLQAADVDGNGVADISDILQINKFRLGKTQTL